MGKTKPVWMVALQSAADDLGMANVVGSPEWDWDWRPEMGDQLAKGWADSRARGPIGKDGEAYIPRDIHTANGAPSLNPTEAEVQAEEDMLP